LSDGAPTVAKPRPKKRCADLGKHCSGKKPCCDADATCQERRCIACAVVSAPCREDAECCGGVCCINAGIDPVGSCCSSQERCCGSACCTGERGVCDFRFLMCVTCHGADDFCNELTVCCPGLRCDVGAQKCVPL
jgi:hypothetical protein